jgi:rhamnose utilization protein RhaD (predicted bifunctional aldolase and dehydrogenase)
MKFDITNFQTLAANLAIEGEVCDLAHAKVSTQTETDTEIAPLIQQVGATSIAEIDRLIAELQEAKNYLQSEGERVEREMVRYTKLTQMASFTAKIIFDVISQWHPASNQQKTNASEITAASTEDDISAFEKSHHHSQGDTSELGQAADAPSGSGPKSAKK